MASEVTSDLNSELSGLNNLCSSAFLAPKCFFQPFKRKEEERRQNGLVDLRACSSPQIKIGMLKPVLSDIYYFEWIYALSS